VKITLVHVYQDIDHLVSESFDASDSVIACDKKRVADGLGDRLDNGCGFDNGGERDREDGSLLGKVLP